MGYTMGSNHSRHGHSHGRRWRITRWTAAGSLLLLPLLGMHFTDAVKWTASDFVFASILLFGSLGAYELLVGRAPNAAYRAGLGLAILAIFLLEWINAAVGITDGSADLALALSVPAVGLLGALMTGFEARGLARTMFGTALVPLCIGLIALGAGLVPAHNPPFEILGITGFFAVLLLASGGLFRMAATRGPARIP